MLCTLSKDGTLLGQSIGGSVKLWNTQSATVVSNNRLRDSATSALAVTNTANTKNSQVTAVGSSTGTLVLLHGDDVVKTSGHRDAINMLVMNQTGTRLYSCSNDKRITCWDVKTGKSIFSLEHKLVVSSIAISENEEYLAVASSAITLYELSSKQPVATYVGHASPVTCLAFTEDNRFFLSGTKTEKHISLWPVQTTPQKKGKVRALQTIVAASAPLSISSFMQPMKKKKKKEQQYSIAVTTDSSQIQVFEWRAPAEGKSKPAKPLTEAYFSCVTAGLQAVAKPQKADSSMNKVRKGRKLDSRVDNFKEGRIVLAAFQQQGLLVVRESTVRPAFVFVDVKKEHEKGATLTLGELSKNTFLTEGGEEKTSKKRKVMTNIESADPEMLSTVQTHKKMKTLSELLTEKQEARESKMVTKGLMTDENTTNDGNDAPRSGSIQVMLSQALHNGDQEMIEYCLTRGGEHYATIQQTIARLPASHVLPLLSHIIAKVQDKPVRGVTLLPWVQEALKTHTSYLMGTPNLNAKLAPLVQFMNARLLGLNPLLKLAGRLDLLLAQVSRQTASSLEEVEPLNIVNDQDLPLSNMQDDDDDEDAVMEDGDSSDSSEGSSSSSSSDSD